MSYYAVSALINFVTSTALGSLIFFRNPKGSINYTFALFAYSSALWSISYFLWQVSSSHYDALFWSKALMAFATLIPIFYHHFLLCLLDLLRKKKFFLIFGYVLFGIFAIFNLLTNYVVLSIEPRLSFDFWPTPGILFHPLLLAWLGYTVYNTWLLYKNYSNSSGVRRIQLKYLLFSTLAGFGGGITNYFLWYNIPIPPFGNILVSLYVAITAYAIAKHRFLDIRFVVARTVAYVLLISIIAIFYTGSTFLISSYLLATALESNQLLVSIFLTLIIALTFQPLRKFLERATDKVFFKGAYDSNTLLNTLTKIMATTLFLSELTHKLLKELLDQMRISRGVFILTEAGKIFDIEAHGYKESPKFNSIDLLSLMEKDKTLVFEELEEGALKDMMRKLDITIAAPLRAGNEEIGILLLGEKLSGDIYSDQDLKLLEIFTPEASVAIQNAKSYEEIRRFNITLREEIAKATKELKVANIKLEELDKLKDEFISVTSHDLRTPMTAIKYYLWLILHGKAKTQQKIEEYLQRSYTSSERMITLINDLLNVSRIESGRIQLNLVPTDLTKVIREMIDEIMSKATEKQITLAFSPPKEKLPLVLADAERFPEVLTNLMGNAIKFTPNGGKVSVFTQLKDKEVEISISDTGVGIKKEDRHKLFTKFGRLDSSYVASATQGGTGLGLYITKNLVELHGGKIWVESQVGKGTTFTFTVKVATEQDLKKTKTQSLPTEGVYLTAPA